MNRRLRLLVLLPLVTGVLQPMPAPGATPSEAQPSPAAYPATRTVDVVDDLHGTKVPDPYRWLEDGESDEVKAWGGEQNAFARRHLDGLGGREALSRRLGELFYVDSISIPTTAGDRSFYTRRHAGKEKDILYWRAGEEGAEQVLIDPNELSADGSTSLGGWEPSPDGRWLAYLLSENNADEATLHVLDVASGAQSEIDRIEGAKYAHPSWTPAGDGFYYTWVPPVGEVPAEERPGYAEIRFHALGTDPTGDVVVRERTGDPGTFHGGYLSDDGHWLFATVSTFTRTDVYFRDARVAGSPWVTLTEGVEANHWVEAWEDRFYVMTNDGASRYRVLRAEPASPARDRWREIVPEADDAVLEEASVIGGRLALTYLRDAAGEIEIRTLDGEAVRTVPLPGVGSTSGIRGRPGRDEAYFSFSSFLRPREVYRTSMATGETTLWSAVEVPVEVSDYVVEQVRYPSKDGTEIPMFVVHRKDIPLDGSTPFLLYGYGGFSYSLQPGFNSSLFPWLEAGGGYALASLRGGGEYGEDWHRAGMLGNKQNVFDDFIAAGEFLVSEGYTRPERLAAQGGSNGGLLVGAALTQRPDLFAAVICQVPLLDMVRYHRFGSGRTWVSEYGTAEREEDFRWLHAYSPYHHVEEGTKYPAVLVATSEHDDRVDPLHARKMTAALQAATGSDRPVLLRVEANAGHGGSDLVRSFVAEYTDYYAFLFDELKVVPVSPRPSPAGGP